IYIMYFLIAIIGFLAFTIIASLLSINKIHVDTSINTITFVGLLRKKTIATNDIHEYFETVHRNAFKSFYGLLLKQKDNGTIQVTGQNIKSLSDLRDYLDTRKIKYSGQTKMKFPF
ncbi:MAG TPA: hypothetical protein VGG71_15235, partial [Chitinophagaceae bacterium]